MNSSKYNIAIVGGGLAGIAAAITAAKAGHRTILLEASDRLGGRVKTDEINGFKLDRGFQVLLSAYRMPAELLAGKELQLQSFRSGAAVRTDTGSFTATDPRREGNWLGAAMAPIGSISDKWHLLLLLRKLGKMSYEDCFLQQGTAMQFLLDAGFSKTIIQRFFIPFFGGIFLERSLTTPAAMLQFVLKCFSEGRATVPAAGMEALVQALQAQLGETEVHLHCKVKALHEGHMPMLEDGTVVRCKKTIVACDPGVLIPQLDRPLQYQHTTTYYFEGSDALPAMNRLIGLDARSASLINNYARMDEISASYAPAGRSLWTVTTREAAKYDPESVQLELAGLLGVKREALSFLRSYDLPHALPVLTQPQFDLPPEQCQLTSSVYLAGDHLLNASIDGALRSGVAAATAATETLERIP